MRTCVIFCMFDWSGENGEKSGNFDILCEWQPCLHNYDDWQLWLSLPCRCMAR